MTPKEKTGGLFDRLKHHSWFLALFWTGCIASSLLWNLYEEREKILDIARNSAQITFENDILYRKWAAKQGGVYVPISEDTPPNPYLNVPDRDVTTSSGLSLTLVNPAYLARQVNQMAANSHGSRGHLTSLNPIRPENVPDPWEAAALKSFEKSLQEVSSVEKIGGEEYMRLMHPFLTEKDCLKCHASQGYKEGDIRGGISVSIPMTPLWAIQRPLIARLSLAHLLLWIIGIAGILIAKKGLEEEIFARERAESVLKQEKDFMKGLIETASDAIVSADDDGKVLLWNPAAQKIFGYTPSEALGHGLEELMTPERSESKLKEAFLDGLSKDIELELMRKGGNQFPAEVSVSIGGRAGEESIRTILVKDITGRKEAEEALKKARDGLEIQVQKRTAELARANERLRQLSSKLISAQEEERKRVAMDIHDTLGACLTAIKFKVEGALQRIGEKAELAAESLNTIIPVIQEGIEECRRIQMDLRPSLLDDLGLLVTLSWFCRGFQTIYSGIRIEQEIDIQEGDLPHPLKLVVFRVVQEAMNNIAKHSKADVVRLSLRKRDERIELLLQDNGRGFNVEKDRFPEILKGGLGLSSMRERTESSEGYLEIESAEGKGTIIRASWPLHGNG